MKHGSLILGRCDIQKSRYNRDNSKNATETLGQLESFWEELGALSHPLSKEEPGFLHIKKCRSLRGEGKILAQSGLQFVS